MQRNLCIVLLIAILIFAFVVNNLVDDLNKKIEAKNSQLNKTNQQLKEEKFKAEGLNSELSREKAKAEELHKRLTEENRALQSKLKEVSRGGGIDRKDAGVWKITFYTPSAKECGNSKGITASGKKVIPNYTVAIDKRYWTFNTKFYVEGFGVVEAMDTGGAIKGANRMDICLLDVNKALSLGVQQRRVWVIE